MLSLLLALFGPTINLWGKTRSPNTFRFFIAHLSQCFFSCCFLLLVVKPKKQATFKKKINVQPHSWAIVSSVGLFSHKVNFFLQVKSRTGWRESPKRVTRQTPHCPLSLLPLSSTPVSVVLHLYSYVSGSVNIWLWSLCFVKMTLSLLGLLSLCSSGYSYKCSRRNSGLWIYLNGVTTFLKSIEPRNSCNWSPLHSSDFVFTVLSSPYL